MSGTPESRLPTSGLLGAIRRLADAVESWPLSAASVGLVVYGLISLRNMLEIVVAQNLPYGPVAMFVHYPLAYFGPFVALTLVLAFWARIPPARVSRLMMLAWSLTLVPPLIDALSASGTRQVIAYLAAAPDELPWIWLHFFDPRVSLSGTTAGIRIETFAAVALAALYVLCCGGRVLRALGAAASVYVTSLFFFSLPVLVLAALRVVAPGATSDSIARHAGLLYRKPLDFYEDPVGALWLVPLLLLLGLLWRLLERRAQAEDRWVSSSLVPPHAGGAAFLALGLVAFGLVAAFSLNYREAVSLQAAPYDYLSLAGVLTAAFLAASAAMSARESPARAALRALAFAALAAALGRSVATGLLATAGPLLALSLLPLAPLARRLAAPPLFALSGAGAVFCGFAAVIGPEASPRIPETMLLAGAIAGGAAGTLALGQAFPLFIRLAALPVGLFAVGFALGGAPLGLVWLLFGGAVAVSLSFLPQRPWSARVAGLAAGAVIALLGGGYMSSSFVDPSLRERFECVARLHVLRGALLADSGQADEARLAYNKALECDPSFVDAHQALGILNLQQEKLRRARESFEAAHRLEPRSSKHALNLATVHVALGRHAEALELVESTLPSSPRNAALLFVKAQSLDALERHDEATKAWRRYVRVARHRPEEAADLNLARRRLRELTGPARSERKRPR